MILFSSVSIGFLFHDGGIFGFRVYLDSALLFRCVSNFSCFYVFVCVLRASSGGIRPWFLFILFSSEFVGQRDFCWV